MTDEQTASRPPRRRVSLLAPAKVNLHLEVLRLRHDGYHDIETILQAVSLFDGVEMELAEPWTGREPVIDLDVDPVDAAPGDRTNLAWRAAELFCERTGRSGHLRIRLRKEIPSEAGLGGGSSDAAAVLVGCDRLFGTGLPAAELEAMAAVIGSDVPFFIRGGTQLGRGRGTKLTPLSPLRTGGFLLVKPELSLSTASVYEHLNLGLTTRAPKVNIRNTEALIARFPKGSWFGHNRLEDVVLPSHPELQRLLMELRQKADVAMLAGSGAAVFAVFDDERGPAQMAERFREEGYLAHTARPHPHGVVVKDD